MAATPQQIDDFLAQTRVAVVGVSTDQSKFGWIVYQSLKTKGYEVFAVNPRYAECHGEQCYATVADLPERPGLVVLVVPPAVSEQLMPELAAAGVERVWLQPGAESPAAVSAAEAAGLQVVHSACIMMA
jgi:predicted CoA-binding protein